MTVILDKIALALEMLDSVELIRATSTHITNTEVGEMTSDAPITLEVSTFKDKQRDKIKELLMEYLSREDMEEEDDD